MEVQPTEILERHPLASAWPPLEPAEYEALIRDIKANGVLSPITIYDGRVLNGGHRLQACQELGIPCPADVYDGRTPVDVVRSLNLHRRHVKKVELARAVALMNLRSSDGQVIGNPVKVESTQLGLSPRAVEVGRAHARADFERDTGKVAVVGPGGRPPAVEPPPPPESAPVLDSMDAQSIAWAEGTGAYVQVEIGKTMTAILGKNLPTEMWQTEPVWITTAFARKIWRLET